MIIEYHRPSTLDDALNLLARTDPVSVPLAGGTTLDRSSPLPVAVVDLQNLGLSSIQKQGNTLIIGATATLQTLLAQSDVLPGALVKATEHQATYNLRHVASVGGTLVSAGGRSPFATVMMALDAVLTIAPGNDQIQLSNLLHQRKELLPGRLITQIAIPINTRLAYQYVARTPADLPIVCAALALWPAGRTRLTLGGFGASPVLAFDGPEAKGLNIAAQSAYSQAADEWASADYRMEVASVLAGRCLEQLA